LKACEYDYVFAQPKKINRTEATLYVRPNSQGHARIGLLVSKRSVRFAVARNRIKRLIRESFRHQHASIKAVDIVFVARHKLQFVENKEMFQLFSNLWDQLK
jgi:ribonuclease P protein component